jgi:hypothetical protein
LGCVSMGHVISSFFLCRTTFGADIVELAFGAPRRPKVSAVTG